MLPSVIETNSEDVCPAGQRPGVLAVMALACVQVTVPAIQATAVGVKLALQAPPTGEPLQDQT